MAATLVNLSGYQYAIAADETGINVSKVERDFQNPREELKNRSGQTVGFATNFDPRIMLSITGEISGNTGHAAANFVAATTIGATFAGHGIAAGGAYLTSCKDTETRDGFRILDATYTALPLVT